MNDLIEYIGKTLINIQNVTEIEFKYPLKEGGELYAHLFIKSKSKKLYVIFNGALSADRKSSFLFQRYSWHSIFDGSVLYITDPTLIKYPQLTLAWYSGIRDFDFLDFVVHLVFRVQDALGSSQIITYGSSGGGYTALQVASRIGEEATAVSINPQTSILAYETNPVNLFFATCFGISNTRSCYEYLNSFRFNAIKAVKNSQCKVLYIQNTRDVFHVKRHYIPFMRECGISEHQWKQVISDQDNRRIKSYLYSHVSGHGAEPKSLVSEIIDMVDFINRG